MRRSQILFLAVFFGLSLLIAYWWHQRYTSEADELKTQISSVQSSVFSQSVDVFLHKLRAVINEDQEAPSDISDTTASVNYLDNVVSLNKRNTFEDEYPSLSFITELDSISIEVFHLNGQSSRTNTFMDSKSKDHSGSSLVFSNADIASIQKRGASKEMHHQKRDSFDYKMQNTLQLFGDSLGIDIQLFNISDDSIHVVDTMGKWYWMSEGKRVGNLSNEFSVQFSTENNITVVTNYNKYLIGQIWSELLAGGVLLIALLALYYLVRQDGQRKQQQLDEKDRLIANIAHELKTPVATVSVSLEALEQFGADKEPERRREYIRIARQEISRLQILADRALASVQLESGVLIPIIEDVDLANIIEDAWDSLSLKYRLSKDQLCYFVSQNGKTNEVAVNDWKARLLIEKGDPILFQYLFYNLFDNACKYGGQPLKIKLGLSQDSTGQKIFICDNGPGIPKGQEIPIFERFYRIDNNRGHEIKGHGLGLPYARQIAEAHGGSLYLDTSHQNGACFVLTFQSR